MPPVTLRALWTEAALIPVGSFVLFLFFGTKLEVFKEYVEAGRWLRSKLFGVVPAADPNVEKFRKSVSPPRCVVTGSQNSYVPN